MLFSFSDEDVDEDVDEGVDIPALSEPLPVQSTIEFYIV